MHFDGSVFVGVGGSRFGECWVWRLLVWHLLCLAVLVRWSLLSQPLVRQVLGLVVAACELVLVRRLLVWRLPIWQLPVWRRQALGRCSVRFFPETRDFSDLEFPPRDPVRPLGQSRRPSRSAHSRLLERRPIMRSKQPFKFYDDSVARKQRPGCVGDHPAVIRLHGASRCFLAAVTRGR